MNINLSVLLSNAKIRYIALVCRCCIFLLICGICFSPLTSYSATGGGGSTRGGGTGSRSMLTTVPHAITLSKGYIISDTDGSLMVAPYDGNNYTAFRRIDTSTRVDSKTITAKQKGINSVVINLSQKFWVSFYNYKGQHTLLGTSPKFQGTAVLEVPANTTYIIISSDTAGSGTMIFTADVTNIPDDLKDSPSSDSRTSFSKFNNQWMLGLIIDEWSGKNIYGDFNSVNGVNKSNNLGGMYRYKIESGETFSITHDSGGSGNLLALIHYYDVNGSWVGFAHNSITAGQTASFTVDKSNASYVQIWFQYSYPLSVAEWENRFTVAGFNRPDVYSNFYQVDNSSTSTIINNHGHSTKNYNIESGDNSPIIIIDGNGNTINLPGASPIVNSPPEGVIIPGESPPGDDDDDDKSFWDIIGDMFGGIGEALEGLLSIIMMPLNFIISAINELVGLLNSTLTATAGLGEFMTGMFGWMPAPIPALLVTFMSGLIVVAFIKFLRG